MRSDSRHGHALGVRRRQATFTELFLENLPLPIAVVGNGKLYYPFGRIIEGHTTVIRLNAFRLAGYEEYCGSRTTHWCTFGETTGSPSRPQRHRTAFVPFSPFTQLAPESLNLKASFRRRMVFAARFRLRQWFPRPSTGFSLLLLLEELGYEVNIFGFDGFRSGHYYNSSHQHDPVHSPLEFDYLLTRRCIRAFVDSEKPFPS
jgi:hypothetical protein